MRVTDAHMSPIFGLYSDPGDEVLKSLRAGMASAPDLAAVDDLGVKHRVWTVTQPKAILRRRGNDGGQGSLHRRRASSVRDGARLPRRDAREARREPGRGVRARADVPVQHGRRGDRHPPDAPGNPLLARFLRRRLPREGARPPAGRKRATDRPRTRCGRWRRRAATGRRSRWSTGGNRFHLVTFPDLRAFCDRHLSRFPPQLRTARRRASPRLPVRAAAWRSPPRR